MEDTEDRDDAIGGKADVNGGQGVREGGRCEVTEGPPRDARRSLEGSGVMTTAMSNPQGAVGGPKCVYTKRGVCKFHGEGAIQKWKPTISTVVGPTGKKEVKKSKKYYWVCDLGVNKRKMTQTRLSFAKTTSEGSKMNDTVIEGGRFGDSTTTSTAGQQPDSVRGDRATTETGNDVIGIR